MREALLWELDGLSEYDIRPADSNRDQPLGAGQAPSMVESWYYGKTFDRPFPEHLPWWDDDAPINADAWATEHETRQEIVERYRRVAAHADATIDDLALDSPGHVPWRPRPMVTLHTMLVHVLAETNRHAGHADILREHLDGQAGMNPDFTNLPEQDAKWWEDYRARIEQAARKGSGCRALISARPRTLSGKVVRFPPIPDRQPMSGSAASRVPAAS